MKLKAGQKAIDFTTKDIYGKEVKLSNFKGQKIMLGFFRNVNCPFCNMKVHELKKLKETFDKQGLQMIFLFESKPELLLKSIFHQEVSPIPLIGDPQKTIYAMYGVENSTLKMLSTIFKSGTMAAMKEGSSFNLPQDKDASLNLIPADFLIDEQFNIITAHYGNNLNDHISVSDIKAFAGLK